MPYIGQDRRVLLGREGLCTSGKPGDLAYIIYREALTALGINPETGYAMNGAPRFEDYAKVVGAIECAKMELYRRLIAKSEDLAIERNGDLPGSGEPEKKRDHTMDHELCCDGVDDIAGRH